jgi:hypothetical protein
VPAGRVERPSPIWLQFVGALNFIQQSTGVPLDLPIKGVTREDVEVVIDLAQKIRAGIWEGTLDELTMTLKPGSLSAVSAYLDKPQGDTISVTQEQSLDLFGVRLPLGPVVMVAQDMRVSDKSRAAMSSHPIDKPLVMTIVRRERRSNMWMAYTKWLTPAQLEEVRRRVPGISISGGASISNSGC